MPFWIFTILKPIFKDFGFWLIPDFECFWIFKVNIQIPTILSVVTSLIDEDNVDDKEFAYQAWASIFSGILIPSMHIFLINKQLTHLCIRMCKYPYAWVYQIYRICMITNAENTHFLQQIIFIHSKMEDRLRCTRGPVPFVPLHTYYYIFKNTHKNSSAYFTSAKTNNQNTYRQKSNTLMLVWYLIIQIFVECILKKHQTNFCSHSLMLAAYSLNT